MANENLYQTGNKPPTSANVYRVSDSDNKATNGMDVELATSLSDHSLEQHVSIFLIISISVFQI